MNPDHTDLSNKIAQAKIQLPMPRLLAKLDLSKHAKKSAHCPFPGHDDKHPSFSIFKGNDGFWHYKCFVCEPEGGDEITFLGSWKGLSRSQAISLYLEMAGFPPCSPPMSREYPESPASPVSEGQASAVDREKTLRVLAARNACVAPNTAKGKRFKLARDLAAIEKGTGAPLTMEELKIAAYEWHGLSRSCLDPKQTRDEHLIALIAELTRVRYPTGENTLSLALENVSKLCLSVLPEIPDYPDADENCRRLAALHRELSLKNRGTHFLSYRDAAKVVPGMTHQQAYDITAVLERCGVIKIEDKGKAGPNSGKAAEFCYRLPRSEEGANDDDGLLEI
jgi:hypothetical protein